MDEGPASKKAKGFAEKDPNKKDLATLPEKILLKIFSYLDLKSLNNCAMLCSTLNNLSKSSCLYKSVHLKYNMSSHFLSSLVSKVSRPKHLFIEYKHQDENTEDYSEFNQFVTLLLRKSGEHLESLRVESCRCEEVLNNISECTNLKKLGLYRCKGTFSTLSSLNRLQNLSLVLCHFLPKTVSELLHNNSNLIHVFLSSNDNVDVNEVCEVLSQHNLDVRELYLSEKKKLKAKGVKSLARLCDLRTLTLINGPGSNWDPEDSLEQVAAGCSKLEKLSIYGWRGLNDDNFIPALHMFTQITELDLRGTNITVKSCREAALTLPKLKLMDVIKCHRVKKSQLAKLQKDFSEIYIPLE